MVLNVPESAQVSRFAALLCVCCMAAAAGTSRAEAESEASPWQEGAHSRLRLVSATGLYYEGKPVETAAIELLLDEGWATYWRSPGDGLPPSLDWSASGNLGAAKLLWPAPRRLKAAEGASSAGYERDVVLPVLITASDTSRPITLHLAISYAVCGDICIPVDAVLELDVPPAPHAAHRDRILGALDRVPRTQDQGVYCPHSFITAVRRAVNGRPALVIKTAFEERVTGLELFVEGPEGQALPTATVQPASSRGRSHYVMFFETEAAVDALIGKMLTLTTVSDQGSCVSNWRVK
jgi:DsbC/DsbD-like thiol-disulfide interchange protein